MNTFFIWSGEYLQLFWSVLYRESLYATVVFGCVWMLTSSKKFRSPDLRYGLWSLVFIRLLLPPNLSLPWSFSSFFSAWQPASSTTPTPRAGFDHFINEASLMAPLQTSGGVTPWFWLALTSIWLGGVFFFLRRFYKGRRTFRRLIQHAVPVENPAVMATCKHWCQLLGIRKPVQVVHAPHTISPFTMGWLKPVIFLPDSILSADDSAWEPAMAHELAHIKRKDDLWIQLGALFKAVYFFHPVVWIALRKCHHERERLCDRMVIRSGGIAPATYGRGLLSIFAKQLHVVRGLPALSPGAALVATRLTSLSQYSQKRVSSFWGALFLLGFGLLLLPMATAKGIPSSQDETKIHFRHPLPQARTSSHYGLRKHPFSGEKIFHKGADFAAPQGTWILAPAAGVVLQATQNYEKGPSYGTVIVLKHDHGFTTFYSHLDTLAVKPGQKVKPGNRLGTVGMTGQTTAPHLHFEIWERGSHVDPFSLLDVEK